MTKLWSLPSPVGTLRLASDGEALIGLWLEGQKYFAATVHGEATEENLPVFQQTEAWLERYFAGDLPPALPLLRPQGSAFRQTVWQLLLEIPMGETVTYGDLTRRMREKGHKAAPQAVGGAVGHNPISLLIPCHRVVGANGSLTGYAGGIAVKERLLALEGVDVTQFHAPARGTAL